MAVIVRRHSERIECKYHEGAGVINGTVKINGATPTPVVGAIVRIYREESPIIGGTGEYPRTLIGAAITDNAGAWSYPYLDTGKEYTAICYDKSGTYEPAIKSRIKPAAP